jgi:hypothetical protein
LAAASASDYTVREACVDFPHAMFVEVEGRMEILPGIAIMPTPGHSPGHQSLLVDGTPDGRVLLAGQAFDSASEWALAALADQLDGDLQDLSTPTWMANVRASDIDLALFAHDLAMWRPPQTDFRGTRPMNPFDPSSRTRPEQSRNLDGRSDPSA